MAVLTIGERIILHLGRYDRLSPDDEFNIPWDLTQDGIATSLRISRAHVSVELKKLKMAEKVTERHSHIRGAKARRKSYLLTPLGMNDSKRIMDFAEEEGIDIMPLLDMRRCDPNALMESIDDESRDVLWLACTLRCSVRRDTLPETTQSVVPVDVTGSTVISDDVKRNVLSVIDDTEMKRMHSIAADYWLTAEEPDIGERLYHLIQAGRIKDACRLMINEMDAFTEMMDDGLYDTISGLEIPERFAAEVLPLKIAVSMESDDMEAARSSAIELKGYDERLGMLHLADLDIASGDPETALHTLSGMDVTDPAVGLRTARAMADLGRLEESKELLDGLIAEISASGDARYLNDVYVTMGTVLTRMGVPEDAMKYLNKARNVAGKRDMKKIYRKMAEVYEAMGETGR